MLWNIFLYISYFGVLINKYFVITVGKHIEYLLCAIYSFMFHRHSTENNRKGLLHSRNILVGKTYTLARTYRHISKYTTFLYTLHHFSLDLDQRRYGASKLKPECKDLE